MAGTAAIPWTSVVPIVYTTWNPSDLFLIGLTGGNLIATKQAGANSQVRSIASMNAQQFYWEILCGVTTSQTAMGLSKSTNDNVQIPGQEAGDIAYWSNGGLQGGTSTGTGANFTSGDVISCIYDGVAKTFEVKKNNTSQGVWTGLSGSYLASWGSQDVAPLPSATTNFGSSAFVYTPPVGFTGLF